VAWQRTCHLARRVAYDQGQLFTAAQRYYAFGNLTDGICDLEVTRGFYLISRDSIWDLPITETATNSTSWVNSGERNVNKRVVTRNKLITVYNYSGGIDSRDIVHTCFLQFTFIMQNEVQSLCDEAMLRAPTRFVRWGILNRQSRTAEQNKIWKLTVKLQIILTEHDCRM